jgi:WASH complex subunit strumpellin
MYASSRNTVPQGQHSELSVNFMGRLVRELIHQTDPNTTTYVESMQGWYDGAGSEVVGIRTFSLLSRACGVVGLVGVDQLICFLIVRDLTQFVTVYRRRITKAVSGFISKLKNELHPTTQFPSNATKLYTVATAKTSKIWPLLHDFVVRVGQAQLLRRQISNELNFTAQLDSKLLTHNLDVFNRALLMDVKEHYAHPGASFTRLYLCLYDVTYILTHTHTQTPSPTLATQCFRT